MTFAVRVVQVDKSAEFFAEIDAACQSRGIKLFELPSKAQNSMGPCREPTALTVAYFGPGWYPPFACSIEADGRRHAQTYVFGLVLIFLRASSCPMSNPASLCGLSIPVL